MRRIDNMTAEQVAEFFAGITGCDVCPIFDKSECHCQTNDKCDKNLSDYLLQDVSTKKRFQAYDDMRYAYLEFKKFCGENHCEKCQLPGKDDRDISCFAYWLNEEAEDEK